MFKTNVTGLQVLTSFQNELVLVRDTGHFRQDLVKIVGFLYYLAM